MRILWFSHVPYSDDINGTGSWINVFAEHLSHEACVELHIAFRSSSKKLVKFVHNGLFLYRVPCFTESFFKNSFFKFFGIDISSFNTKSYINVVKKVKPDIIQIFGFENDFGTILPLIDVPAVMYIQSIYKTISQKWYSGIPEHEVRKYSSLKSKLTRNTFFHQYKRHISKLYNEESYYQYCKYVIGRTDWDKRCSKFMSTNINYYHCDEVLRKEFFANKWIKSTHNNELRVVSIIGGSVYKGLETIIDCFNLIKTHTNIEISWHVIGLSNSDELVKICKNKYKKIDFKNIILHGKKTANQIVDILRNSDIYVHPSHIENSSNAISEAMTFGIPVIATFTGGTNTLIEDNQTGILVQDGEPLSLASAIIDLNSNAEKAKIMGAMARETALKRHNPQEITNILVKIYKDIMSDSHYSTSQTPNT